MFFSEQKLTCVANWDHCHIGELYEDLAGLILHYSDVADRFRNNYDVFDRINLIFDTYQADVCIREKVISYIKEYIADGVAQLTLQTEQEIREYETLKWCETFFDVFAKSLIEV